MESPRLQLEPLWHRSNYCIAVHGRLNPPADKVIRNFPHRKYSKTNSCWYVPYSPEVLGSLNQKLSCCQPVDVPKAFESSEAVPENKLTIVKFPLPEEYHESLIRKRYSQATVATYESQMRAFLSYIHPKTLADISDDLIKEYEYYLADTKKVSCSTQNTAVNAIKFYLEHVLQGERKVYYIDRPQKEQKLPRVLSEEEVTNLIEVTKNVKHRCMLLILYSSGVRMSELLNLRWSAFDEDRMQLFVDGGKGRKDRFTLLSNAALEYAKFYMSLYNPTDFLFEGPGGKQYSPRSVNKIVHRSAVLAGIRKRVSAHTLRHSFATHLLEHGVDLRYIQALMGHESSRTTERYTHVTTKGFSQIKSPLDRLKIDFKPPKQLNE